MEAVSEPGGAPWSRSCRTSTATYRPSGRSWRELEDESYDDLVVAGDIVVRGLHDAECIDLLRELGCTAIAGNTDIWVSHKRSSGCRGDTRANRP